LIHGENDEQWAKPAASSRLRFAKLTNQKIVERKIKNELET
jgi:hypothetical protein